MAENYHPTVDDIWNRAEAIQWMVAMEWPWDLIDEIFYEESPSLDVVRRMVWNHGPVRALEILQQIRN